MPKKPKAASGYSYYKDKGRLKKTVVLHLSDDAYKKLKWKAYLEERSIQKTTRRIIEEALKGMEPPPTDKGQGS